MTKPEATPHAAADDYRHSHLQRGVTYDATLASNPFDAYMAHFEREYLVDTIPRLFKGAPSRYLDFACGTGRITETVAPLCTEAVGVDISPGMLAEASDKCPRVKFIEADITKSEVDLGTFDLATSFRFFGNAQQGLRSEVLRALHRLLRQDAYLIINSHRNPQSIAALLNAVTGGGDHLMDLHYFKFKELLRDCGFEIMHSRPVGFQLYRSKLQATADPQSAASRWRESFFRSEILTPFSPDAVIVARKVN